MITKERAVQIAEAHVGAGFELYGVHEGVPKNFTLYGSFSRSPDDVWCVSCQSPRIPNFDGFILDSSRAIVIDKKSGAILCDDSARDEG